MTRVAVLPLAAALAFLSATAVHAAPALTAADRRWLARCAAQLAKEQVDTKAVRRYCACMHGIVEDNAALSQTEMERLYPPAHRACRKGAGG